MSHSRKINKTSVSYTSTNLRYQRFRCNIPAVYVLVSPWPIKPNSSVLKFSTFKLTERSEIYVLTNVLLFVCVCLFHDYGHTPRPIVMKIRTNLGLLGTKVLHVCVRVFLFPSRFKMAAVVWVFSQLRSNASNDSHEIWIR